MNYSRYKLLNLPFINVISPNLVEKRSPSSLPHPCHYTCDLEVKFESHKKAAIICAAVNVDEELQPGKVKRVITVSDGNLAVHFEAVEPRFLRTSFSAFVDVLTLAATTVEEFGPGVQL